MGLQAELISNFIFHISLFGVTPTVPAAMTTEEGSEFESSMASSETVSAKAGEEHDKKKKEKHIDKGLTADDNDFNIKRYLCIECTYACIHKC